MDANSPTAPRKVTALDRQRQAVKLRIAGVTYEEIGNALGVTKQAAFASVQKWVDKANEETLEDAALLIALEKARLESMIQAIAQQAKNGHIGAVAETRKLSESLRKLKGLDAPTKTDVTSGNERIEFVIKPSISDQVPPDATGGK